MLMRLSIVLNRRFIILLFLFIFISIMFGTNAYASENELLVVYFSSPTCSSCQKIEEYWEGLQEEYEDLIIREFSIIDIKNRELLINYSREYDVPKDEEGIVPVVFIRDQYLVGEKEILGHLDGLINEADRGETLKLKVEEQENVESLEGFSNLKAVGVFAVGLINGLNPCSLSMLLLFISLVGIINRSHLIKVGLLYSLGKFIGFFLMGTVLFKFLNRIHLGSYNVIIKGTILIIIAIIIILNINDYFAAKNERYNRIKLQLPLKLRSFNHRVIKRVSKINNIHILLIISMLLGFFISFGEFLCAGQIYLATIVTVLQSGMNYDIRALLYFIIYGLGFVLPILLLTYVVYRGKEVFELSEFIRERLHIIKLINAGIFILFGIITILFF